MMLVPTLFLAAQARTSPTSRHLTISACLMAVVPSMLCDADALSGRDLTIVRASVKGQPLVLGNTHLESPVPGALDVSNLCDCALTAHFLAHNTAPKLGTLKPQCCRSLPMEPRLENCPVRGTYAGEHAKGCKFAAEREQQLRDSLQLLQSKSQGSDIVLGGDMNWIDPANEPEQLLRANKFVDVWPALRAGQAGLTYDARSNPMLTHSECKAT
eukprot:1152897-Pelagomonas_calceolata.AAC.3